MALIMGAAKTLVMPGFMRSMYTSQRLDLLIVAGSAVVFVVALWLVRSQSTVGREILEMKALIDDIEENRKTK